MSLPVIFATLAAGDQNLSLFDTQFAALGALVVIPCAASGQNAVVLTPNANTPTVAAYSDLSPIFTWKQAQTFLPPDKIFQIKMRTTKRLFGT